MNRAKLIVLTPLLAALIGCGMDDEQTRPDTESQTIAGKFAPANGTLLIIGQDVNSIAEYREYTDIQPGGVTTYTNISEGQPLLLNGLENDADWGAGHVNANDNLQNDPDAALAIGLYLVDTTGTSLSHIIDGTHDDTIDQLGRFIDRASRPVFLRIGYEFDGPWNHYNPEQYIGAYRHIVDRLRLSGVDGFASVWQSATSTWGTHEGRHFSEWYPGDDYVDWMGTSYFVFNETVHDEFLNFARKRSKPVMIAESSPQGYDLDELTFSGPTDGVEFESKSADQIWEEWFGPFFQYIHSNGDVIRAVAYINADWNSQSMWQPGGSNGYWGDSRVQVNDSIFKSWLDEISSETWVHGGPELRTTLNFSN